MNAPTIDEKIKENTVHGPSQSIFRIQKNKTMSQTKLETSLSSGHHHELHALIGEWTGHTRTWFEPGDPVDESPMNGTIRPLFDGRFILHEYRGSFQGQAFEGMAIYGYHLKSSTFQCAWMDTFHMGTGIMLSEGKRNGSFFKVMGTYEASANDPALWGWRTEISVLNQNEVIITAYNISPEGAESKATETIYKRIS